jgi:hypothetical protein
MERPTGVTTIAIIFFLAAAYLLILALIMLLAPGAVSMMLGSPLLGGLELAGPYMFLLMGALGAAVGLGLLRLNNWARRAAALICMIGFVMLIPEVSIAVVEIRAAKLVWGGLGIMVRVVITWYLYQSPVAEVFTVRKA